MGLENGNETAGGVLGGQTPATEVAPSQTPEQSASQTPTQAQVWKARIGDTEYDEQTWKTKGVEDFRKFHGEFTRTKQEAARLRDESGAGLELLQLVKGDPKLLAEVRARMQAGQSQEQAVQQATQNDPRVDQLYQKVDAMEQEKASNSFRSKHPDLSKEDVEAVASWIQERTEKLKNAGWSYDEILEAAYAAHYVKSGGSKAAAALVKGQEMKEQEIQKGRKGQLLGAPAPTARTESKSKKPTIHMSPAEREKHALDRFKANKKG